MRIILVMLVCLVSLSGCLIAVLGVGAVLGASAYDYATNELVQNYSAHIDRVFDAAMSTVKELQFKIEKHSKDALAGQIEARRADNTLVRITVNTMQNNVTRLTIRVGEFGDFRESNKQAAETIRDKINLKVGR